MTSEELTTTRPTPTAPRPRRRRVAALLAAAAILGTVLTGGLLAANPGVASAGAPPPAPLGGGGAAPRRGGAPFFRLGLADAPPRARGASLARRVALRAGAGVTIVPETPPSSVRKRLPSAAMRQWTSSPHSMSAMLEVETPFRRWVVHVCPPSVLLEMNEAWPPA